MSALDVCHYLQTTSSKTILRCQITKQTRETDFERWQQINDAQLPTCWRARQLPWEVDGLKDWNNRTCRGILCSPLQWNGMRVWFWLLWMRTMAERVRHSIHNHKSLLDYVTQNWGNQNPQHQGQIVKKNDIKVADGDRQTICRNRGQTSQSFKNKQQKWCC